MEPVTRYVTSIRDAFPDLPITSVQRFAGQNNDVLLLNATYLFRFPKYADGIEKMEREKKLLQLLHPLVPLPVPLPEWSSINRDEIGKTFVGYRQFPGSPLWPEKAAKLPHRDVHHMARQLSRFLGALHHIPVEAGVEIGLPTPDIHGEARIGGKKGILA